MAHPGVLIATDTRGVVTITIDRPDRRNAYDGHVLAGIDEFLSGIASDGSVRLVCIRGSGRQFCAGADIKWLDAGEPDGPDLLEFLYRVAAFPKPAVALVHGACIGGGLALAACCDVIVASEDAFFSIPEVRLGFTPAPLLPLLARLMPQAALRRYALSGERFDASDAYRLGMAQVLCPSGGLDAAAAPVLEALLRGAPTALSMTKAAFDLYEETEDAAQRRAMLKRLGEGSRHSPDASEGRAAFAEKRDPAWYRAAGRDPHRRA